MPRPPKTRHPLRNVREAARLTQAQLAKRVGVGAGMIEQIENGKKPISRQLARKLYTQIGCHIRVERSADGSRSWVVSDQIMHGYFNFLPYTHEDFIAHERTRHSGAQTIDRLCEGFGAALTLLLKGAGRSGQLMALEAEILDTIQGWEESYGLEDHIKGVLRDEGFDAEQVEHLADWLVVRPSTAGCEYLKLARILTESREVAGQEPADKPIKPAAAARAPAAATRSRSSRSAS